MLIVGSTRSHMATALQRQRLAKLAPSVNARLSWSLVPWPARRRAHSPTTTNSTTAIAITTTTTTLAANTDDNDDNTAAAAHPALIAWTCTSD